MPRLILLVAALAGVLTGATDAVIESAIKARLAKSKISTNGFQVKVQNGVATLTGKTSVIQHKGVATRLAKAGGAKQVNNKIEIASEARANAAAKLSVAREKAKPLPTPPASTSAAPTAATGSPEPLQAPPPVRKAVIKH